MSYATPFNIQTMGKEPSSKAVFGVALAFRASVFAEAVGDGVGLR